MSAHKSMAEWRDRPPTDAELAAHAAVGGLWRCVRIGQRQGLPRASHDMSSSEVASGIIANDARLGIVRRWWSLTSEGDFTVWPEVA